MSAFFNRNRTIILIGLAVYGVTGLIVLVSFVSLNLICSQSETKGACLEPWKGPVAIWLTVAPVLVGFVVNADEMRRARLRSERDLGEATPTITVLQNAGSANAHIANVILTNWNSRPVFLTGYKIEGPNLGTNEIIKLRFEEAERHFNDIGKTSHRFSRRPTLPGHVSDGAPHTLYFQLRAEVGKSVAGARVTIICDVVGSADLLYLKDRVHQTHWSPSAAAAIQADG